MCSKGILYLLYTSIVKENMNAVGPEMEEVESGCWPQKMQLLNLMYL